MKRYQEVKINEHKLNIKKYEKRIKRWNFFKIFKPATKNTLKIGVFFGVGLGILGLFTPAIPVISGAIVALSAGASGMIANNVFEKIDVKKNIEKIEGNIKGEKTSILKIEAEAEEQNEIFKFNAEDFKQELVDKTSKPSKMDNSEKNKEQEAQRIK